MSRLFFGTNPEIMASHLGESLQGRLKEGDPFVPIEIVVPNPYLGKWLRLHLARQLGVAMNIRFSPLEQKLWGMLDQVDTRKGEKAEMLGGDLYRFLVLSVLLEYPGPELESVRHYLGRSEKDSAPWWRRAWHLADRMASLIRDYEYHRQEALIHPWIDHRPSDLKFGKHDRPLERAQGTLFHEIIREPRGRRNTLNVTSGRQFKTLPQYAGEILYDVRPTVPQAPLGLVYLFGITQMSELHARTVAWFSHRFDMQCYFLSPLTPFLRRTKSDAVLSGLEELLAPIDRQESVGLKRRWMRAGMESLWRMQRLMKPTGPMEWELLQEDTAVKSKGTRAKSTPAPTTVLAALQSDLLEAPSEKKLPQDCSLQIVGCPGVQREVETVYGSILHNLQRDPTLQMTDIAILATDMETYRPALQAAFERDGKLGYSLIDHSAAGMSLWGQALLGMLDLAQENFARSLVFEVILNPCVLARLGVERAEAQVWLHWAEELGAYHGWDVREREERGQAASSLFAWRQALQRLRLGRYMDAESDPFQPGARFGDLAPHSDIHSADRRQLDGFCRAVEGLVPLLIALRSARENGRWWAEKLRYLAGRFLAVPEESRPEARVRDQLLQTLEQLELWDDLHENDARRGQIPLALVREFVNSGLQGIAASRGDYLTAGVTIAGLQPMRPVPFQVIYVVGMNEALFPGRNALPSLDLRSHGQRERGDIWPAEQNLFLLLEVLLSARSKLYFFFNNRELQKDRELLPAAPLLQLKRHLDDNIVDGAFQCVDIPLHSHDDRYLQADTDCFQDVLVQHNEYARAFAIHEGVRRGTVELSQGQQKELAVWRKKRTQEFTKVQATPQTASGPINLRLKSLRQFLLNPAQAFLDQRLRIEEGQDEKESQDDEPFVSECLVGLNILHKAIAEVIRRHVAGTLSEEAEDWTCLVDSVHEDYRLRCQAPTGVFGEVDRLNLGVECTNRMRGVDDAMGLKAFLEQHPPETFCGPILLGESATPVGAKLHFPALKLGLPPTSEGGTAREVRLTGHFELAWWKPGESFDLLLFSYTSNVEECRVFKQIIEPLLFCLALLAQKEGPHSRDAENLLPKGISPRRMLQDIRWNIHLIVETGIKTWTFAPGLIATEEAVAYLSELTADYLDNEAFDLLPLPVILKEKELYEAAVASDTASFDESGFREQMRDAIESDRDSNRKPRWDLPLLELLNAEVPQDALAKCRRRFALLDRGLAAARAEKEAAKETKKSETARKRASEKKPKTTTPKTPKPRKPAAKKR